MVLSMGYYVRADNISEAWLQATSYILSQKKQQSSNLLVEIINPLMTDKTIEKCYVDFCNQKGIKHFSIPANTIFPKRAFEILKYDRKKLYQRSIRLYKVLKGTWGSYFNQMINWQIKDINDFTINQLEHIITMLNDRSRTHSSAYTIQITNPKDHTNYVRGGPCLHYILLQLDRQGKKKILNLLAVYRNHDFAVKAYGNYVGLGHLMEFLCSQTDYHLGKLSCLSSHAFIAPNHKNIITFIRDDRTETA
jgi:thymidylate synthase